MRLTIGRLRLYQSVNDHTLFSSANRGDGPHDRAGDPVFVNNEALGFLCGEYLKPGSEAADPSPALVLYERARAVPEHQLDLDCDAATRGFIRRLLRGEAHLVRLSGRPVINIELLSMPPEVNYHFVYRYIGLTWKAVDIYFERRLPDGDEEEVGHVMLSPSFYAGLTSSLWADYQKASQ